MFYVAIGGMKLKKWTGWFKIIYPTLKVLKSAKQNEGCVKADIFKHGDIYFAVSVWDSKESMKAFAKSGLHSQLTNVAMDNMAVFYNHTHETTDILTRDEMAKIWVEVMQMRDGKGTRGQL